MKFSYAILKQLVPSMNLSPKDLAELLTMRSFETAIDREYIIDPNITVVKIIKIEKHPNADKLRLATVTDGTNDVRVVCGAPNIEEGQLVPYAPPGTKVYDDDGDTFMLQEAVIRGEKSPGMLNSVRELGISDNHGGILILPPETPVGSKLHEHIPSDSMLDVDVLPDRAGDANTHYGMAREIAALLDVEIQEADQDFSLIEQVAEVAQMGEFAIPTQDKPHVIVFHPDRPAQFAGIPIEHAMVKNILERLRFKVREEDQVWRVSVPSDRKDVLGEHNLIDEVVRVHGLDEIPIVVQTGEDPLPVTDSVYWEQRIRELLVQSGFTETYSYSFEDERFAKLVGAERHPHVELKNPMAPELKKLRYSMLPGLLAAMNKSRDEIHRDRKGSEKALFEIGRVYHQGDSGTVPGIVERRVISGIMVGDESSLQEIIDKIRELFGIEAVNFSPSYEGEREGVKKTFATVRKLEYAGEFFGITYVLSDELLKKLKYRLPLVAFEISFGALLKHAPDVEIPVRTLQDIRAQKEEPAQFAELPKYPSVFRDISMIVDPAHGIDIVESLIWQIGGSIVSDVDLFDEYTPDNGQRSLAFHVEYRLPDKTLTDTQVDEVHRKIEHALKKQFGAEIR